MSVRGTLLGVGFVAFWCSLIECQARHLRYLRDLQDQQQCTQEQP